MLYILLSISLPPTHSASQLTLLFSSNRIYIVLNYQCPPPLFFSLTKYGPRLIGYITRIICLPGGAQKGRGYGLKGKSGQLLSSRMISSRKSSGRLDEISGKEFSYLPHILNLTKFVMPIRTITP